MLHPRVGWARFAAAVALLWSSPVHAQTHHHAGAAAAPADSSMQGMPMPGTPMHPGTPEHPRRRTRPTGRGRTERHEAMAMPPGMHEHMAMRGMYGPYPMTREASGTSWQPDNARHQGLHEMRGPWT